MRERIQCWLQDLLEDEVRRFLGRDKSARRADVGEARAGYRNGYGKPRLLPVLGRQVVEGEERLAVLHQALDGIGLLGSKARYQAIEGVLGPLPSSPSERVKRACTGKQPGSLRIHQNDCSHAKISRSQIV